MSEQTMVERVGDAKVFHVMTFTNNAGHTERMVAYPWHGVLTRMKVRFAPTGLPVPAVIG